LQLSAANALPVATDNPGATKAEKIIFISTFHSLPPAKINLSGFQTPGIVTIWELSLCDHFWGHLSRSSFGISNTVVQAGLTFALCRRKQAVIALALGISPAQSCRFCC